MRFEVLLNGKRLCIAGVPEFGVLSTIVCRVKRNPAQELPEKHANVSEDFFNEYVELSVGGLNSTERKSLHWIREFISAGDEVTIRVLEPGEYDPPKEESGNAA